MHASTTLQDTVSSGEWMRQQRYNQSLYSALYIVMQPQYQPAAVERPIQQEWADKQSFRALELPHKPKYYCLSMFPYPSGKLHMGHVRNYTIGDVMSRYHRMRGFNVLQPMGWDAFGLPAENAAMDNKVPPAKWTYDNIAYMKKQLKALGFAIDWKRELATCKPEYYRWNQWLFLRMLAKGIAYKKMAPVNWCPSCRTVLANEQVVEGACERCGTPVVQRDLEQWFFRITDYADRLLEGLDRLEGWPVRSKVMQRNWIGRSEGAEIRFSLPALGETVTVFTIRPDTLHGATFLVLPPESPFTSPLVADHPDRAGLAAWIEAVRNTPRIQRSAEETP